MISVRSCGLTLGIFGAAAMFFLAWEIYLCREDTMLPRN